MDKAKFDQALQDGACDVVDTMLSEGYVPKKTSIKMVCRNGNITLLRALLHSGKYVMDLQAGLFISVLYKQTHLLDHLYLAGANVNLPDKNGNTLLHHVEDEVTCKWLLDMGTQQTPNDKGSTPLHRACRSNRISIVKLLLSCKQGEQSLLQSNKYGYTPLFCACIHRRTELVELLLSYQQAVQTISYRDKYGRTALDGSRSYPEIQILLRHRVTMT